uniref:Uncharacterized protein n=1 Tax=Glycine max TaxID=3847 RepID=A0A0R0GHH7_SOYBN
MKHSLLEPQKSIKPVYYVSGHLPNIQQPTLNKLLFLPSTITHRFLRQNSISDQKIILNSVQILDLQSNMALSIESIPLHTKK